MQNQSIVKFIVNGKTVKTLVVNQSVICAKNMKRVRSTFETLASYHNTTAIKAMMNGYNLI